MKSLARDATETGGPSRAQNRESFGGYCHGTSLIPR